MPAKINYESGQRIGQVIYLQEVAPLNKKRMGEFQCFCGNVFITQFGSIKSGNTQSCGCIHKKQLVERNIKHGLSAHPIYATWSRMKDRCLNPKNPQFYDYGGRGISICDEWRYDVVKFHEWSISNGWEEGLEIDRFPNINGNYEPTNCRWATEVQQQNNKRSNRLITYNKETKTLTEWAKERGLTFSALQHRLNRNWPISKALNYDG